MVYAKQSSVAWAQLRNEAGTYVEPSLEGAALAADQPNHPDNMEVMVTDSANSKVYPITGFTWLLVYENQGDEVKADAVANLAWWMIHEGQQYALPLEYAPLKGAALKKAESLVKRIKVNGRPVLN